MTFFVDSSLNPDFPFEWEREYEKVARKALEIEKFPFEAEIGLTIVDSEEIKKLNGESRGIDRVTDVLSFPMVQFSFPKDYAAIELSNDNINPDTGEVVLGDIVICAEKVYEQAEAYGHSVKREYAFLIAHSVLHLLGYDHVSSEEAEEMEKEQEVILRELGITRDNDGK
ncbi:MAG: rRNA maturation RNase YbeY [Lachnospiraceae bacterium]|nr:rRNA maturation RNase YbeY [Lachnospiraceae bacterium]